ncbi:hypothetical protein HU200_060501 [Digitaria exilis]|uniref:Uncharacterized protein n=1 Tax=Digitaria exilis TaxID=1010633 RepID=A0A835E271_9POAL|nr:hypothetical protein HU200_060501 [Digitaria exilis]
MEEYDLDQNFVIVNICYLDVHVGILQHSLLDSVPYGEACMVGRGLSGDLMARSVELGGDLRVSNNDKDLDSRTAEAWEGAIIFSIDGEFVGMNLFLVTGKAIFLPWSTILKRLEWFGAPACGKSSSYPEDILNQEQLDLDSMGYPKLPPTMLDVCDGSDPSGGPFWKMPSDATDRFNRWPVPMPYWCLPKDKPEVHDDGDVFTVGYIMGTRTMLC